MLFPWNVALAFEYVSCGAKEGTISTRAKRTLAIG